MISKLGKIPEPVQDYLDALGFKGSLDAQKNQVNFAVLKEGQCNEFCQTGKCKADCCGCVSILESYFRLLKKLIPSTKEYHLYKYKESDGSTYVKPITQNCKCVFLSDSNSCLIHDSNMRPSVCKRFGSDPTEPLYACAHVNEEFKDVIQEFGETYLQKQSSSGNIMATHILKNRDETES